jgi:hypothetical protein
MNATASPAALAHQAAEAVRSLNHATIFGGGYEWPSDVDGVLVELELLARRIPQALYQASRWLAQAEAAGQVGHDRGEDAAPAVVDIETGIVVAREVSAQLADTLNRVRQITAHLTGTGVEG